MALKYCNKCHAQIELRSKYCSECGASTESEKHNNIQNVFIHMTLEDFSHWEIPAKTIIDHYFHTQEIPEEKKDELIESLLKNNQWLITHLLAGMKYVDFKEDIREYRSPVHNGSYAVKFSIEVIEK